MTLANKIVTVIVTYNGLCWIQKCIESLLESSEATEIVVVDNASTDGTVALIRSKYPAVQLLQQFENLGFGKANNNGMTWAMNNGASHVFLLNQDTIIEKDALAELLRISNKYDGYGLVSPVHFNYEGEQLEYYFEQFANKNNRFKVDYEYKKGLEVIYDVPFVNAAAWLIPISTLETVGGFDPIFHHYGEDNNYCQRLNYHQFKIGIVPSAKVRHDSKKRKGIEMKLFSVQYFLNEIKQLQIRFADINRGFNSNDRKQIKQHNLKLIVRNLFKLNLKNVRGYIKKYQIFEKEIERIKQSRKVNQSKGASYL
jgi:GT2 family glycosyltransferase